MLYHWQFLTFFLLASIPHAAAALCPCRVLSLTFPLKVSYPNTGEYNRTNSEYWNKGGSLKPTCIFYPTMASHVSLALRTLVHLRAKFAIKSGGHMSNPAFNNIHNGVLISTDRMKDISWAENDTILRVSAGALWSEVYAKAEEYGKVVVGGRVGDVGVSGFLLGGGMSHLGAEHGFGSDNVAGMQVVLANGHVVDATPSKHPDLFKALKGGSSNFGFVTRFDLSTYPIERSWGGKQLTLTMDDISRNLALDATVRFHLEGSSDIKASLIPTFGMVYSQGFKFFLGAFFHTNPPSSNRTPAVFNDILALGGIKSDVGFYSLAKVVEATGEGVQKGVARNTLYTNSIIASRESIAKVYEVFHAEFAQLADIEGLLTFLTFQPVPKSFVRAGRKNGGNIMGISPRKAPYSWISQSVTWTKEEDDARVKAAQAAASNTYMTWAQKHGLADDFLYLNDAEESQDVFAGYGEENREFLRAVRDKYDPTGVFTHLMPGGYKV